MSAVSGVRFERLCWAVLPVLLPPFLVLILIAAVPAVTLWLPDLVLGAAR